LSKGLLADEDTIEELTLVLVSDLAHLADSGAGLGEKTVVNAVEDEFILDVLGEEDLASGVELDQVRFLSTQEVLDFDLLLVLGDDGSDGEMRMDKSHLVAEALGDSSDHVVDMGLDGGDGTSLSVAGIPHLDADVFAAHLSGLHIEDLDVQGDVREVFGDSASGTLHGDFPGLAGDLD